MLYSPKIGSRIHLCGGGRGTIKEIVMVLGFRMFKIALDNGKVVTEARYRFDVFPEADNGVNSSATEISARKYGSTSESASTSESRPATITTSHLSLDSARKSRCDMASASTSESRPATITTSHLSLDSARKSRCDMAKRSEKDGRHMSKSPMNRMKDSRKRKNMDDDSDLTSETDDDFIIDDEMDLENEEIKQYIEGQENEGTAKKTSSNINTLLTFLREKRNEFRELHEIPAQDLNRHLCKYFMNIKRKNGDEYEPSTIKGMLSSFNRHLRKNNYQYCLVRSEEFSQLNLVLSSKQVELKKCGKGNKPRKSDCLTDTEVDKLYENGQLGTSNPKSLLHTVWFNNMIYFGMRSFTEHHDMRWGDLRLGKDTDGEEFVEFTERTTKTRNGSDVHNVRLVTPKMWALKENAARCPVTAYKKYKDMRPSYCKNPGDPFYLAPATVANKTQMWYKAQRVGVNSLRSFMKDMATEAGLTDSGHGGSKKRLTNHSARKYMVQSLSNAGVPGNQIMQISGHKNIQSLNDYSSVNTEQHRTISAILGGQNRPISIKPNTSTSNNCSTTEARIVSSQMTTTVKTNHANHGIVNQVKRNQTENVNPHPNDIIHDRLFGNIYGGTFNITINFQGKN